MDFIKKKRHPTPRLAEEEVQVFQSSQTKQVFSASKRSGRKAEADARPELVFPLAGEQISKSFPTRVPGGLLSSSTSRALASEAGLEVRHFPQEDMRIE